MAVSPRRVEVSIGEVVVDGLSVPDHALFAEALRSHLGDALAGQPAPGRSAEHVDGGTVRVAPRTGSHELGAGVAHAVARALGGSGDGPVTTQ